MQNKKALIIVDLQNDFISGSMAINGANNLALKINNYVKDHYFDEIITTQDWHCSNHPSFKKYGGLWPEHCIANTWGAQIDNKLNVKINHYFYKAKKEESYSGFYSEQNCRSELYSYLNKNNIKEVFVCGLALDYCVIATAVDSSKFGFKTTIIKDLTCSVYNNSNIGKITKKFDINLI